MNIQEVQARLDAIAEQVAKHDDERAHGLADKLWRDVLMAIAEHDAEPGPATLAQMALHVEELDFARWCA